MKTFSNVAGIRHHIPAWCVAGVACTAGSRRIWINSPTYHISFCFTLSILVRSFHLSTVYGMYNTYSNFLSESSRSTHLLVPRMLAGDSTILPSSEDSHKVGLQFESAALACGNASCDSSTGIFHAKARVA